MKLIIKMVAGILFFCNTAFTQVLSEFRNIGRTGVYNEADLLKKWPENGPTMLWSNEAVPYGYSSVAVVSNAIYLTGMENNMDVLVALDIKGNIKWKIIYGESWNGQYPPSRNTPTVENDRVYVSSGSGDVACIDANTGEIVWKMDASEKFKGTFGTWGIAESLLIIDEKVIYTPGGEITTMVALNKNTGETIWQSESINDTPAYVSPLLVEKGGKQYILTVLSNNFICVDAKSGDILSKFNYASQDNEASLAVWDGAPYTNTNTPIYKDGGVFITSGYNHIGAKFKLSDDFKNIKLEWITRSLDVHHGGVVLVNGYIYGANWTNNAQGNWCCVDWETGETKFEQEWYTKGSIISADGMLYCYEEKSGNLALVSINPNKFDIVSSFQVPLGKGPHWSHLVIHEGILYVRHCTAIMAYDIKE